MQLKVIQLNIEVGAFLEDAVTFLNAENPDVLFLQEVGNSQGDNLPSHYATLGRLKSKLTLKHVVYSPTGVYKLPEGMVEMGNAIFSRYPLELVDTIFYDVPYSPSYTDTSGDFSMVPRNLQHAILSIKTVDIHLFNTHGIWGKGDNERKNQMAERIVQEIKGKKNVILAGDFNTIPDTKTIKLIESMLSNVAKDRSETTFNMRQKTNPIFSKFIVDMIFISKNIQMKESSVPDVDISDHLPVVASVELTESLRHKSLHFMRLVLFKNIFFVQLLSSIKFFWSSISALKSFRSLQFGSKLKINYSVVSQNKVPNSYKS